MNKNEGGSDDRLDLTDPVDEVVLPPPIDLSKVARKIYNAAINANQTVAKTYETPKDALVDIRVAWEELLSGLKDGKTLERFMMPAARISALFMVMIHKFGDRDYKPFLSYLDEDINFEIPIDKKSKTVTKVFGKTRMPAVKNKQVKSARSMSKMTKSSSKTTKRK